MLSQNNEILSQNNEIVKNRNGKQTSKFFLRIYVTNGLPCIGIFIFICFFIYTLFSKDSFHPIYSQKQGIQNVMFI